MFSISLYSFKGKTIEVHKGLNPSYSSSIQPILTCVGTLRDGSSKFNPIVEIDVREYSNGEYYPDFNMFRILEFGRNYFVTNIEYSINGLLIISGRVDVLSSFERKILNQKCIISRNEYADDNGIYADNRRLVLPSNSVEIFQCGNLKSKTYNILGSPTFKYYTYTADKPHYLVSVIGEAVGSELTDESNDRDILRSPTISPITRCFFFKTRGSYNSFMKSIMTQVKTSTLDGLFSNPAELVVSSYLVPFDLSDSDIRSISTVAGNKINLAGISNVDISVGLDNTLYSIKESSSLRLFVDISTVKQQIFTSWKDHSPYSSYYIYLPFIGIREVDSSILENTSCIYYDIDIPSGEVIVYLSSTPSDDDGSENQSITVLPTAGFIPTNEIKTVLATYNGNAYTPIPIGLSNKADLERNKWNAISSGFGTIVASTTTGAAVAGVKGGLVGFGAGLVNAVINYGNETFLNAIPKASISQIADSALLYKLSSVPFIVKYSKQFKNIDGSNDTSFRKTQGVSTYIDDLLTNIHGYTEVLDIDFDNTIVIGNEQDVTEPEAIEITNLLKSGVILP